MDLSPRHRLPLSLPAPWPSVARPLLGAGAPWLQDGASGESLLGLPAGPVLESRWSGPGWVTRLDGRERSGSPWEALAGALPEHPGPWVGAASFELACDEAGLPRRDLAPGALGQRWQGLTQALHFEHGQAELWSWEEAPPDPAAWAPRLGGGDWQVPASLSLHSRWVEGSHRRAVEAIRERILEGEFYVANLCVPFEGHLAGLPHDLAQHAFRAARPPFGALLDLGDLQLLCLSMERLLTRRGERIWSQPIKGSAPLSGDPETDRQAAEALAADPKERAEHTMIVDLVRNDLGRVARTGTVAVGPLMSVEAFPTVQHLVSTVEAEARPGLGLDELLRAVLPGGSVTGAPKHAVCSHLAQAEAAPRGFYCGALGWIAPSGDLDLALPIRTAQIREHHLTYWAGGGVTRRSDPAREWAELHLKTRAILG